MKEAELIVVLVSVPDVVLAEKIASKLVELRLAACVNIIPKLRSIYRWQGKIEHAEELLLVIKTERGKFAVLEHEILGLHVYDTPEILALSVAEAYEKYGTWIRTEVSNT